MKEFWNRLTLNSKPAALAWLALIVLSSVLIGSQSKQPLLAAAICFLPACALGWTLGPASTMIAGGAAFGGFYLAVLWGVSSLDFNEISQALAGGLIVGGFAWQSGKERQALDENRRLSVTDPMTGLLNRRGFLECLSVEANRSQRVKTSLAVAFLDCDCFKAFNDTLGHLTGDRLLMSAANRIRETIRNYDSAARLGGDEFAIIYPGLDLRGAEAAIRRLQAALQMDSPQWADFGTVTWSIGVAVYAIADEPEVMLEHADQLMYAVKRTERGKVLIEEFEREPQQVLVAS